ADPCQNGGRWTGMSCVCPPHLEGAFCQFGAPTINITGEVDFSVRMVAHITNRNFSEDLKNTSSNAYRSLVDEFIQTMDRIYHNVSGYGGVRVLTLTRGSVIVNYEVLLRPPAKDEPTTTLDHRVQELLEAFSAVAQPQNCSYLAVSGMPCGAGGSQDSPDQDFSSLDLCRNYTPANFSRFYQPYRMQSSVLCTTSCSLNVPISIDCKSG
ncbi:MUC3B protein, partial [Centropus bengalensis]|nr:MUC3B protein [Centropus bengalensis]